MTGGASAPLVSAALKQGRGGYVFRLRAPDAVRRCLHAFHIRLDMCDAEQTHVATSAHPAKRCTSRIRARLRGRPPFLGNHKEFAAMNRLIKHIVFCVAMIGGTTAMAGITFYESENFGGRQIRGNEAMPNFR